MGYVVYIVDKFIFMLDFNGVGMIEFVKVMVGFDYVMCDLGFFFVIVGIVFNDLIKSVIYCDMIGWVFMKLFYIMVDM